MRDRNDNQSSLPSTARFNTLLMERLVPEFCSDPSRNMMPSGFLIASNKVTEVDARNFMRAWNAQLFRHEGRGQYISSVGRVREQFFWSARKTTSPRTFTLWMEPVITMAALARLHFDYGWPVDTIGLQSIDWAFAVVAYRRDSSSEHIAGEVKKSASEAEALIRLTAQFGADPSSAVGELKGAERNAFKKIAGLRNRRAPIFWVVGPAGYSRAFEVRYCDNGSITFCEEDCDMLRYS